MDQDQPERSVATDQQAAAAKQEGPPRLAWTGELEAILEDWRKRTWASQVAHYRVASRLRRNHTLLGVPVVILSAVVGTSLFATLNDAELALPLRVTIGSISVVAAVLAAMQNFFGFAQLADKHVLAADWNAAIRRKIEQLQGLPREIREDPAKVLDALRKEMNTVSSQFPEIGESEWRRTAHEFGVAEPPPPSHRRSQRVPEAGTAPE